MKRSLWLLLSAGVLLPVCIAAAAPSPNVIIVLSDDQGYGDFSCHGNPMLKTPNLDKLHLQSVRLIDFHVAPMCSPTRGQLMTGLDALRNGATSVTAGRTFVQRGIPTMAEMFAASGYRTAIFGKWHLGDMYPYLPHQRGFQEAVHHLGWGISSLVDHWLNDYFNPHVLHNGVPTQMQGYCTDAWFDLALNWMKERKAKQEPFFLYLPTNTPHGPAWVADKYKAPYQGKAGVPAAFFGMIANLDANMGRLEKFLTDEGLRDNTIVIFFNDNGGTGGVNLFNAGMRGRKTQYYEGGHRAACFIRWPDGRLGEPRDIDALSEVQDLLPTLVDFCGLKKPADATFDGVSLAGLLQGKASSLPDRTLVVQYGQTPKKWEACVMRDKWRLVNGDELYDLKNDFAQKENAAAKHPDVLAKLRADYEKWWDGVEPRLNDFSPITIGADQQNPVTLTASDWQDVYCDNMNHLRDGVPQHGPWNILVEKDGTYHIALRRWPKEAGLAITASAPAVKLTAGEMPAGKALPIAKIRLKIGDSFDQTKTIGANDKEVTFTVPLKAGTRTKMWTACFDAEGKELCGAYFAYVERK